MSQRKSIANQRSQEEKEEVAVIPNWSELFPDLLRCVFKRLNFIDLNRVKLVCSSWHDTSRGCKPKQTQTPMLILFPRKEEEGNDNNNCVLYVPEDKDNVYKTRDLGVDFVQSICLTTYGSWLLMMNRHCNKLYILNPLTGERIEIPDTKRIIFKPSLYHNGASFWVDNRTKDYLVVLTSQVHIMFTKKGVNKWHELPLVKFFDSVYNHKNQKLYVYHHNDHIKIFDISGNEPREDGLLDCGSLNYSDFWNWKNFIDFRIHFAVTISGDVLVVAIASFKPEDRKTWGFRVFKGDHVNHKWVSIDSLGDEALILDMGVTVVAKDVQGIKRNSIYFNGFGDDKDGRKDILVFDLATQKIEHLPQCVSSLQFSNARWFFPGFNG